MICRFGQLGQIQERVFFGRSFWLVEIMHYNFVTKFFVLCISTCTLTISSIPYFLHNLHASNAFNAATVLVASVCVCMPV